MSRFLDEDTPAWVRWTLVGAVLVVLVVVGGFLWLLDPFSTHEAAPPPTSRADATATPSSTSVCGLPDGDQALPAKAPQVSWEQVGSLLLPASPTLGPGNVSGTTRTCFAHSPAGAVIAAMNPPGDAQANPTGLQYAGFRIIDATVDRVTLEIAFRITQGAHAGLLFSVPGTSVWQAGDWHVLDRKVQPTPLNSIEGFVPFGPGGTS